MSIRNNRSDINRKRHLRKREWRQALEKQYKEDMAKLAQSTNEIATNTPITSSAPVSAQ